ncbi:AI-2E family transporter [Croceicoccus marinus]|jgi:predicted PurR-regulated permease PerM|uniref:AI-2E family transporter n=1 Tax=Croceicoccus marinus TaxID=450378 RepID=A0A7G6VTD7_9SPHN|nr:AI-2E family transporter [Croceicoccus marinus]QNE05002.1 AI-2E family transporter [Croceicoccus marinus]
MDEQSRKTRIEHGGFLLFLLAITVLLAFVAWPFLTALFWAMLAAIMFQPLYRRVLRNMGGRRNRAAALTLLVITVAVVIPLMIIGTMIVDQATGIYLAIQEEQLDASEYFRWGYDALPARLQVMIDNSGYGDFYVLQQRALELLQESVGLIASKALEIGGGVLGFALSFAVGLYAAFFMLRDGEELTAAVRTSLPMKPSIAERLVESFVSVTRATIKGSIVVGLVQGALGAITFWIVGLPAALLFGLLMAIFSLLPAVGTAIVWVPAAIYLLATGAIWQGLVVIGSGVLVIGMADNALRPILVGRDTGLPDWVILVTTLGGIGVLGITGIVVGPVAAGLFITGWAILREQRGLAEG